MPSKRKKLTEKINSNDYSINGNNKIQLQNLRYTAKTILQLVTVESHRQVQLWCEEQASWPRQERTV